MKVSVYLQHQVPARDLPPHRTTRTFARLLAAAYPFLVKYDGAAQLQLRTPEAWSSVKARLRPKKNVGVPQLLPPRAPLPLMLTYPPKPQGTDGVRQQRELWLHAERF